MAARNEFLNLIGDDSAVLICADEVHNIGATEPQNIMRKKNFGARIGLSATPTRNGSTEETSLITEYLGTPSLPCLQ